MRKMPRIAESEWKIMQVLWERGPLTANEVVGALSGEVKWKSRTIKTLISRLVRKGAVKYREEGTKYRYYPAVRESQCIRSETQSFIRRVYQGGMKPALAAFLQDTDLSPQEIDELQKILDQKRKG